MIGDIFPHAFWALALAHALALVSPGPDFMIIVSHSARHRLRGSAGICAGIAAGNAVYIALAIVGWTGLGAGGTMYRLVQSAGAAYLGWLGYRLVKASRTPPAPPSEYGGGSLSAAGQFGLGLGSALLNPKNMIFYLAIMTALLGDDVLLSQRVAVGVWMCMAVLLWDLFVAAALSHPVAQRAVWKRVPLVEKVCGTILVVMAASLMIAGWM